MLDHFLKIAHRNEIQAARDLELDALYTQLPVEDLRHVVATGEVKLAFCDPPMGESQHMGWLDHFRGTPLLDKAIALEEQELKNQAECMQRNSEEDVERQQGYREGEQIRLQKRLLELERAKLESSQQGGTEPALDPTPVAATPEGPAAKVAMSGGLVEKLQAAAPHDVKMSLKAGDSKLMSNQIKKTMPGTRVSALAVEKDPFGKAASVISEKLAECDTWGRDLARADVAQAVRADELSEVAQAAVKEAAVTDFLKAVAPKAIEFAKVHPGAVIGGGLGALHGLMRQGGGVGSALVEGAGGAALGHGAQHFGGQVMEQHPELAEHFRGAADRLKSSLSGMMGKQAEEEKHPGGFVSKHPYLTAGGLGAAAIGGVAAGHGLNLRRLKKKAIADKFERVMKYYDQSRATNRKIKELSEEAIDKRLRGWSKQAEEEKSAKYKALKTIGAGAAVGGLMGAARGSFYEEALKREAKQHPKSKLRQIIAKHPALTMGGVGALAGGVAMTGIHGPKHTIKKDLMQLKLDAQKAFGGKGKERDAVVSKATEIMRKATEKKAEVDKEAFGAVLGSMAAGAARMAAPAMMKGLGGAAAGGAGGGMAGLAGKAMGWLKQNPMKAIGAGMNAASNFAAARQSGQGLGGSLMQGLAGGAQSLG